MYKNERKSHGDATASDTAPHSATRFTSVADTRRSDATPDTASPANTMPQKPSTVHFVPIAKPIKSADSNVFPKSNADGGIVNANGDIVVANGGIVDANGGTVDVDDGVVSADGGIVVSDIGIVSTNIGVVGANIGVVGAKIGVVGSNIDIVGADIGIVGGVCGTSSASDSHVYNAVAKST